MVDTMVAGGNPDLYYEYLQYSDMTQFGQLRQDYDFGPVTVPMVSTNSSPPIAMPVQVPHGHVVQQIVDESGTLRHVILSPQHPPPIMPMTQRFGGSNPNSTNQAGPGFFPGAAAIPHGYAPYNALQPGVLGPPPGHSPPPPAMSNFHKDERSQRQYNKLKRKYEQKYMRETLVTPPHSPKKEVNGNHRKQVTLSEEIEETGSVPDDDDVTLVTELTNVKSPQVSEITCRTALVQWSPPQMENSNHELKYEVLLSDRGKDGKYKSIYQGEALSCRIEDLRPGTEYCVCVSARLDNIVGCASEPTVFTTPPCRPEQPTPPKLTTRTKNSLTLKWQAVPDNGSHIDYYIIERDINGVWTEIARPKSKMVHIVKLAPASAFLFRLAAVNQCGKSEYSIPVKFETSDTPPPQPAPPTLKVATSSTISLIWASRPTDDEFTLQMEDVESQHGFLAIYNGKETSYTVSSLLKNTCYKFRLKSHNDEGSSQWSDEVAYRTQPGRPGVPSRPQLKGRVNSHCFRLKWDQPVDKGGAPVSSYTVQIAEHSNVSDWKVAYTGSNPWCVVERLHPGTPYQVRVSCEGPGGTSEFSEPIVLTTEAVCPGKCQPPRLQSKPRSRSIPLKWQYPENDGGAPITELEVVMRVGEDLRTAYRGRDTEFVVMDLRPSQLYSFMVRASNRMGGGPWSDHLDVQCASAAPDRPTPPTVSPAGVGISCSWSPPQTNGSSLTSYTLQMCTSLSEAYITVFSGLATSFDVKPVPPATLCFFRLQACNGIGPSEWSESSSVHSSAGVPGPVLGLKVNPGATSLSLLWTPPSNNGEPLLHYTVEVGESIINLNESHCIFEDLLPSTCYKVKVRAVNSIGSGAVVTVKSTTLDLPPEPPVLMCTITGHNYLKLRWGPPNYNPNNLVYRLTMVGRNSRKSIVYEGMSTSHKINRLQERSEYKFTLTATNTTGTGPDSPIYTFITAVAPPAVVKGVKVLEVSNKTCLVEWLPVRPQASDKVEYVVQCARLREQSYKQVFRGSNTRWELTDLEPGADYLIRVGAIRVSVIGPIEGPLSPPVTFSTPPVLEAASHYPPKQNYQVQHKATPLSDQQWACIILCCFTVLAVLFAVIIANIIY